MKLLLKFLNGLGSLNSLLLLNFLEFCQRNSTAMRRDEEYLPATSEDCDEIGVRIFLSNVPQILFSSVKLVKAFLRVKFIHKNELPSIHDHAMASVAREGEDDFVGISFNKLIEL